MSDISVSPYFDDFDSGAGYHQILFKPGFAVQARELTQSQSMLRNQIAKFGDHVFKHGSVVLPGNVTYDLNICAVKLTTNVSGLISFVGGVVTGTSGLRALIKAVATPTPTNIHTTIYVSYYNTGSGGEVVFGNSEELTLVTPAGNLSSVVSTTDDDASTGAAMASINAGVFYINGSFVEVDKQTIVISKYTSIPNCMVLLKITESIVSSDSDNTLLDPAQGSYNYAAPGADRLKIKLTLVALELGTEIGDDYVELIRFSEGKIQEFSRYPKYNELEKSLARRTYDESGDYISGGLKLTVHESMKKQFNGGKSINGSINDYAIEVSAGKAYISGFESESLYNQILTAPKGRVSTPNHIKSKSLSISPNFGQYLYVTNLKSLPDFANRTTVALFDTIAANNVGTNIGYATVISIDLHEANYTEQANIYKLYVTDISSTSDLNNIGSIKFNGGSADVLHKLNVPISGVDFVFNEIISYNTSVATICKWVRASSTMYVTKHTLANVPSVGVRISGNVSGATGVVGASGYIESNALSSPIIKLPIDATFKVRTNTGSTVPVYFPNMTYKVYKEITIGLTDGAGSFTISDGSIDPIEIGNTLVTSSVSNLPLSRLSLSSDGKTITYSEGNSPTGINSVKIVCVVTKTNVSNRNKTLISYTDTNLVPSTNIRLTKADIYRLVSVVSTVDGDVTNRFKLNNGQTDYAYTRGFLLLIGTMPTGTLTVSYEYFNHSGTGDYFSIDSYVVSGLVDYYSDIRPYMSTSDGTLYDLRNCLDFRPKFEDSNNPIDMLVVDSRITTDVQYYVPRIDSVILNKTGEAYVEYGIPDETPRAPSVSAETVQLGTILVPAYTYNISDMIVYPSRNKGYKMKDILRLEDRISNIEQYSLLTQTETTLINSDIVDATTGLSRYKSGYLVETFINPEIISDVTNNEFNASYIGGRLYPAIEKFTVDLEVVSTTGYIGENATSGNKLVTMPYVSDVFAQQNKSTRVSNINPFSVFSWKGGLTLVPSVDNFVVMNILPPVYETIDNVIVETVTVDIPRAWGFQPEIGSLVSFVPWRNGTTVDANWLKSAIEWHSNANDLAASGSKNDPNPANWWWIP